MRNSLYIPVALVAILAVAAASAQSKEDGGGVRIPAHDLTAAEARLHVLNRLTYGPTRASRAEINRLGIEAWIERQLDPAAIEDAGVAARLAQLETVDKTPRELLLAYPPPQLLRAVERVATRQGGIPESALLASFPQLARMKRRDDQPEAGGRENRGADREIRMARERQRRAGVELAQAKVLRAVYSERQLLEVMTDFWFNHFNVYAAKATTRYWIGDYERSVIRANALGNFRDLLGGTADHPAMLLYLDNWQSSDPDADIAPGAYRHRLALAKTPAGLPPGGLATVLLKEHGFDTRPLEERLRRTAFRLNTVTGVSTAGMKRSDQDGRTPGLNENYARELMELHTLGVDGGYDQDDIVQVARAFTGWTVLPIWAGEPFAFASPLHDGGARKILGETVKGKGMSQGRRVLDLLASHPSTARFVSEKIARRFVMDEPSPVLVDRMADTFLASDGDIKAVLRTLLSSPEFWSRDAVGAKVKTPLEFVVSAARATGAELRPPGDGRDGRPGVLGALRELDQTPYMAQAPTGYGDTAEDWVSTGALLNRMKVALGLAGDRLPGTRVDIGDVVSGTPPGDIEAIAERLLGGPPSPSTVAAIDAALDSDPEELAALGVPRRALRSPEGRARLTVGWLLASPEFQRR